LFFGDSPEYDVYNKENDYLGTIAKRQLGKNPVWTFNPDSVKQVGLLYFEISCQEEILNKCKEAKNDEEMGVMEEGEGFR